MHVGRERPPEGRAWGEEGGSQMGVAHAPAVALLGCDSGADSRPAAQSAAGDRGEAADWQEDRASSIVQRAMQPLSSANSPGVSRGTVLPSFGSPTLFPSQVSGEPQPGKRETGRWQLSRRAFSRFFDQRRGSILTRVAASSIESSAPRWIWSRCASRACATALTTASESKS
jgi:hypothetical protein